MFEEQLGHLMEQRNNFEVRNISYLYSMDDAMCDRSPNAAPTFLSERSVCPWEIDWDVKEHRYPPVLAFARCRCSRCFDSFECRPVYYRIPVLERECLQGTMQYIKAYVAVPVGCVCVEPRVRRMKKSYFMKMLKSRFDLLHRNDRFLKDVIQKSEKF
ncbi:interleukin-17A-like [Ylistrum balloti]|uniref:interleukin-17A-like n=1 Tax=Ylistrum balloti TaxID=509963 RepID=UPI0029058A23|nr:interleukin-17A-like [Ylistrum balloti]